MKFVPYTRPVEAKMLINALGGSTRLKIMRLLLETPTGLSASEIAEKLGISLPTILTHLSILASSGLISWVYVGRGRRYIRLYKVSEDKLVLNIDLRVFTTIPNIEDLDKTLQDYIQLSRKMDVLKASPSLEDIRKLLNVSVNEAFILLDYFRLSEDKIVESLTQEALKILEKRDQISIDELCEIMRIHEYWAVQVARRLEEMEYCILEGRILRKIIREL